MEAEPRTEADVLRAGVAVLTRRLPPGWTARTLEVGDGTLVEVTAPDGISGLLVLDVKRLVQGRDVAEARERLVTRPGRSGVVLARYLSPPVRERLMDAGLSYVDATGNVHVALSRPGLFIADRGADRDPWRGPGRPLGTLQGAPAARVVRALIDYDVSWPIRSLVDVSGVSTGSVYRVIKFLEGEGLVTRGGSGAVTVPDWAALLRRWSKDYGFVRNGHVTRWIAPRGLPDLVSRAGESSVRYAVTGTLAAAEWAPHAPARSAMIYAADAEEAARAWGLRPAETGVNVIVAEPRIDVVFARTIVARTGATTAAPAQVAVDLMTGPGRGPSEAEELVEWMTHHESAWRRK
ncbi:hypothetical protein GCM10010191_34680 [Actinomadura vinacea]|uniref:HTH iclR-type domain-containing protein n=1 Tax=Actinomadura vinacea TaxID=115336 RepID=A0ABN3J259_9ACTN